MSDLVPARELKTSWLDPVASAVERHGKPITSVLTIIEVALAAAAIFSLLPPALAVALLLGVPLVSFSLVQQVQIRRLKRLLHEAVPRGLPSLEFIEYVTSVCYSASSTDGYLRAVYSGRRVGVAQVTRRAWTWSITKRSDNDILFTTGGNPTLKVTAAARSSDGVCIPRDFHKSGSNLSFRVDFEPPLVAGDSFDISYEVVIPTHKAATLNTLRQRPKPIVPTVGESEYQSLDLSQPTRNLDFVALLPVSLGTSGHHVEVIRNHQEDRQEAALIERNAYFSVTRIQHDGTDAWQLRLSRPTPPIGVVYRLCWQPPASLP